MNRRTWKKGESRVAKMFGTQRTSLSGGNSKITRSDTMHDNLFIEVKHREKAFSVVTLHDKVVEEAKKEGKTPLVALLQKNRRGVYFLVHSDNLKEVANAFGT